MPSPEFSIPVHDLDASGKDVRVPVRGAWILGALEATNVQPAGSDGELRLRVSKSGTDVVVRGVLTADLTVPCARCLEPARVPVEAELSALAVPATGAARPRRDAEGEDQDLPPEEADVIPYDGDTLILDDMVRDELLLGIPMIPLCSDECPGIRPRLLEHSAEEAIDPRLEPLLKLKKK